MQSFTCTVEGVEMQICVKKISWADVMFIKTIDMRRWEGLGSTRCSFKTDWQEEITNNKEEMPIKIDIEDREGEAATLLLHNGVKIYKSNWCCACVHGR